MVRYEILYSLYIRFSLGIVVKVTLATVPLYKTLAHNYVQSDVALTNGDAMNWAKTTDQIALYWFPALNEIVVANWTIVDVQTVGNAFTNDHVPSTYENFAAIASVTKEFVFGLTTSTCALANSLGISIVVESRLTFTYSNLHFRIYHTAHN